jgi:uncharacterized protein YndB with AHSA1/START domain
MADIKHYVTIKSPAEKVYRDITEQEGLAGWWTRELKAKPEVGFIDEFHFGQKDYENIKMKVTRLDTNKRVDWVCLDGDPQWIGTNVSFELEEKDGNTGLLFTHGNWKEATLFFASCSYNWGFYMNSLRELCNKGKGTPHQDRD